MVWKSSVSTFQAQRVFTAATGMIATRCTNDSVYGENMKNCSFSKISRIQMLQFTHAPGMRWLFPSQGSTLEIHSPEIQRPSDDIWDGLKSSKKSSNYRQKSKSKPSKPSICLPPCFHHFPPWLWNTAWAAQLDVPHPRTFQPFAVRVTSDPRTCWDLGSHTAVDNLWLAWDVGQILEHLALDTVTICVFNLYICSK